jgi:hypothetical protein
VARQQLLRDAVAVVVREDVHFPDAARGEQLFVQRRLIAQRVGVVARLGGEAEADHVRRDDAKARRQFRPQLVPVPRCGREAVDAQQHRAAALVAVEDGLAAVVEPGPAAAPVVELHGAATFIRHLPGAINPSPEAGRFTELPGS